MLKFGQAAHVTTTKPTKPLYTVFRQCLYSAAHGRRQWSQPPVITSLLFPVIAASIATVSRNHSFVYYCLRRVGDQNVNLLSLNVFTWSLLFLL